MMRKYPSYQLGIRGKLILIFIAIKVIPLIILAVFAANQVKGLGGTVKKEYTSMVEETQLIVGQIGVLATENSIDALDTKSREAIERLSTDTARAVAQFLYQRDEDISFISNISPDETLYKNFLQNKKRATTVHSEWILSAKQDSWVPPLGGVYQSDTMVTPSAADNEKEFHYRGPEKLGVLEDRPIYLELTFFDTDGKEKIKVAASDLLPKTLVDISKKENTWCKAENYFSSVREMADDEIYVSEVIGEYVPSLVMGPYTPQSARRMGISFEPEKAAYAGKENPVGKKFQGLIRWVKPVLSQGERIGYVSLALDHTHIMEFTDHIVPTEERYTPISDASTGNYAFMWDYKGRNISHPRDYFIVGYDPQTGDPAVPWLSEEIYEMWQSSGLSFAEFQPSAPQYKNQSLARKPSPEITAKGFLGLDCRYLNFAPQCTGWYNLTQHGGSGSFVIFWSKLWKLSTAASIPYYTGMYQNSRRGFGFITIGANVHEFHGSANETASQINEIKMEYERNLKQKERSTIDSMAALLTKTQKNLGVSTLIMVVVVVCIAFWMASRLTVKILEMIRGIRLFRDGNLDYRLDVKSEDEMGQLAKALNEMSDKLQDSMEQINFARRNAEESDKAKSVFLANMSHEVRTPLNAIIGMSRLAHQEAENEVQRYYLQTVRDSADALFSLINDILDFSKVEAGELVLETHLFDLHECILSTIHSVEIHAKQKGLGYTFIVNENVPKFARGDGLRLKQILLNVLSNAVKFTEKGVITIDVRVIDLTMDDMRLKVTVVDTGIGIPLEMKGQVFDGFSQVDKTMSRDHQGAGLGLAITRRLCQLMGGDVNIDCIENSGCTFVFTVELQRADDDDLASIKGTEDFQMTPQHRILLVEDNIANRVLACMILQAGGHSVIEAANGIEALQRLSESHFDVILMDIQMPGMDGLETTRIIRSLEKGNQLEMEIEGVSPEQLSKQLIGKHHPVIALTAHAMSGDREKCLAVGVDRYLTKPFLPEQIMAVLREV